MRLARGRYSERALLTGAPVWHCEDVSQSRPTGKGNNMNDDKGFFEHWIGWAILAAAIAVAVAYHFT